MREFDINLLDKGDIITKKDGRAFEVADIKTHVSFEDRLEIRKDIKLRELGKIEEMNINVDIKS